MRHKGTQHWELLCREAAEKKQHIFIEQESAFLIGNSRVNYICSKCGSKAVGTSVKGYLQQISNGCGVCNKNEKLMFNASTKESIEKRKKTLELKGYAKPLLGKKGELHPTFKGGVRFDTEASPLWRAAVRANFNSRCFLTGTKENTNAHHLQGRNISPELRSEPLNGVLITETIHKQFHSIYGGGNNTVQQFEEFSKTYYNVHTFPWTNGLLKFKTLAELSCSKERTREAKCQVFLDCVKKRNHDFKCFSLAPETTKLVATKKSSTIGDEISHQIFHHIDNKVQYETTKTTYATLFCKEHLNTETVLISNYLRTAYGLSCCAKKASHNIRPLGKMSLQEVEQSFLLDVQKKGHIFKGIVGDAYKNAVCTQVIIYCLVHKTEETPTLRNYIRNRYGTCCCKKKKI